MRELALFTELLHGPASLEALRGCLTWTESETRALLDSLVARGLVERRGAGYVNSAAVDALLERSVEAGGAGGVSRLFWGVSAILAVVLTLMVVQRQSVHPMRGSANAPIATPLAGRPDDGGVTYDAASPALALMRGGYDDRITYFVVASGEQAVSVEAQLGDDTRHHAVAVIHSSREEALLRQVVGEANTVAMLHGTPGFRIVDLRRAPASTAPADAP